MQRVDYLVLGGGLAGLMLARLLPRGSAIVIEPAPAAYKVGESVVPEQFRHPALAELLPRIQALPSWTRKLAITFVAGDTAATFPVAPENEPAAMHVARHELEALLIEAWDPPIRRERVAHIDLDRSTVRTDRTQYQVEKQILDCSGPAMLVANAAGSIEDLGPISATWAYFDVLATHDERFASEFRSAGGQLLAYDARRKRILPTEGESGWRPSHNTILTQIEPGLWCWQIPLYQATRLSVGVVARGGSIPEDRYDSLVAEHIAACFEVRPRPRNGDDPFDRLHARAGFARRSRVATGDDFALIGDAFAFADPVYSVGTALAVNQAIAVAEALGSSGWTPRARAAYETRCQAVFERSRRAFEFWYSGELLHDDAAAAEVNDGFLVGRAFQATAASTYGDAVDGATLRVGEHRDYVQVPDLTAGPITDTVRAELPDPPDSWTLEDAHRCTDGVQMRWSLGDRGSVTVYCVVDSDQRVPAYRHLEGAAVYYEHTDQELPGRTLAELMDWLIASGVRRLV